MRALKVYAKCIRINYLAGLQYKGWPFMMLQVLIMVVTEPIGLLLMFSLFGQVGVWSAERIILIYAMAVTSFGLAETFCRGFDYFPYGMIRSGEFDRTLLRPCPLFVQIAGFHFHLHRLSRVFGGLMAMLWCLARQNAEPSLLHVMVIVLALCGGFLMYAGVFVMTSGISFFTIQSVNWIYIFTNVSYGVTRCPVDYMPRTLRNVFTFFMPMLVISYYPASAVCGWGESYAKAFLALPAGLAFFAFAMMIWRIGAKHYQSTGS